MAYPEFTPEELATEEWRDVSNYPNYQVSNLGRVRSVFIRILKPSPRSSYNDYPTISIYKHGEKARRKNIHVIVAEAFHGPRPDGKITNHKDGNKSNSRAANLEYSTHSENTQHAYDTGLARRGEWVGTAKLTNTQAAEIIQRLATGEANKSIAKDFPVSETIIGWIRKGKIWTHLPRPEGLANDRPHWTKRTPQYLARGDNNGSRKRYDRIPKGEDSHNAKLTADKVKLIRELYASGSRTIRQLADEFAISKSQVKRIIDKVTWKHVP
jgi:DNA invertase Pin-like site-specific DNA recombinase